MKKLDRQDLMSSPSDLIMEGMKETTNVILEDDDLASVIWRINRKISGRKEMEQYMDVLGKLRHPNVVSLRAYLAYMDCNQMVLVYDIFAGCRLFNLLHGTYVFLQYIMKLYLNVDAKQWSYYTD